MTYSLTWDLEGLFKGGASSPALQERLRLLQKQMKEYHQLVENWQLQTTTPDILLSLLASMQTINDGISQCFSFANALTSTDVTDHKAKKIVTDILAMLPTYQLSETIFSKKLAEIDTSLWETLLENSDLYEIRFRLGEIRRDSKKLLSDSEEHIINTLSLDGIKAWSNHYDTIVASIEIEDGSKEPLSAGQASIKMMSDPDSATRKTLFKAWEKAWQEKAPLFADTLNHIDGFRLADYRLHNRTDFLEYPLQYNRLKEETVNVMWETIEKNKNTFLQYFSRKAKLLGKDKLEWQDQDAPIILSGLTEKTYTFDEGATFIIQHFKKFSPKMASFAEMAFNNRWIEAENRPGKRPGGYCTSLPESQESRIFMTYGNVMSSVSTLAHELGHAFHSSVLWDIPALNREYAMNVAETASTFAELIVTDAALQQATSVEEKIHLLDVKLQSATAMFLNIHTRFIFEKNFYTARQKGVVAQEEISKMMLQAQKEGYHNSLASYHPHFWAAKLHFFIDDVPFYNFPYTFGYLFSMGIYAFANAKGSTFEDEYIALLRDTATMTTEDLVRKHLHADLTSAQFWQAGIDIILKDVETFLSITEDYLNKSKG